jgi:Glucodextranase, domain B
MNPNFKKILQLSSLSVFFLLIIFYAFFVSRDLIFGVRIRKVNLNDGATVTDNIMKITGNAKNAIKLILDGREISVDQTGNFSETIALLPGYNIISIKAQDKFGYIDEKNYKLIYKNL